MTSGARKSRKRLYIGAAVALVVLGGAAGLATLKGASADVDASRLATVERGTMVKSVVATGKVEPITKIEIKSKANGIIKVLNADVDVAVKAGDILVELDREQLEATLRGAEANLLAARASLEGAEAQLKKNVVEAEGPDEQFARRAYDRATALFAQSLIEATQAGRQLDLATLDSEPLLFRLRNSAARLLQPYL